MALTRLSGMGRLGRVVGPEVDLWRSGPVVLDIRRDASAVNDWSRGVRRRVYRRIWGEAAERLGAELEELGSEFTKLSRGKVSTIAHYHEVMLDTGVHLLLALDKGIVHGLLGDCGLPVSRHVIIDANEPARGLDFVAATPGPCVVKPLNASGGRGVTCGIDSVETFERAVVWARRWDSQLIVEQQAAGEEIRLLFLDGHLLGVLRRTPTQLLADGTSTVMELVEAENARRGHADGNLGMSDVSIDLDSLLTLERAGLNLRSVPSAGTSVAISSTANQSGAENTERVPHEMIAPELIEDARTAVAAIGLRLGSVEVITPDPSRSLRSAAGVILEVNGTPGLHYHYLVRDPAEADRVAVPILATLLGDDPTAYIAD